MPDSWTLDTPDGPYVLNQSFAAPKYQPGGVGGPGALRRDDRTTYQRSGDGLATPGPLTLIGRVWRDDQDQALMVTELNAIRNAVSACTSVTRTNNAGTYTYDSLAGGATPEITPDGLGGWMVRLDLWPGRAEPTFVPAGGGGGDVDVLAASVEILQHSGGPLSLPLPATAPAGALIVLVIGNEGTGTNLTALPGYANLNGQPDLEPIHYDYARVWAFTRTATGGETTIDLTSDDWLWGTAHIVIATGVTNVADIVVTSGPGDPQGVTGTATQAGLQLFMGNVIEYGLG